MVLQILNPIKVRFREHSAWRPRSALVFAGLFLIVCGVAFVPREARAAVLSIAPAGGEFAVGSVFSVSVFLDTEEESVNAIETLLSFPPDKLQLVSPSVGQSILTIWVAQPRFNNQSGSIDFVGGISGGIKTSRGLIATLNFRVKSVGVAAIKFLDTSKVLLNDGLGTDALRNTVSGVYQLVLPPPAGPIVSSETHADQTKWHADRNAILRWAPTTSVTGYSYLLDGDPTTVPDDVPEGLKTSVVYKNLSDGLHYFHIKAHVSGAWGGVTHFAIKVDTMPPAEFPIEILSGARTTRRQPVIRFQSSDALSGIDRYEINIIPLKILKTETEEGELTIPSQQFFVEVQSPYVPAPLSLGSYDVIVRAYDKAGNYRDVTQRLKVVNALFRFTSDQGLEVGSLVVIPWIYIFVFVSVLILLLAYAARRVQLWRHRLLHLEKRLPSAVQKKMAELGEYRKKYGKVLVFMFLIGNLLWGSAAAVDAQEAVVNVPLITTMSKVIANDEIFYIGGKADTAGSEIIIYLQNLETGAITSYKTTADKNGTWFYRHDRFLSSGNFRLWAQGRVGDLVSPPSPQVQLSVQGTAIQFGASRLSREAFYLALTLFMLLTAVGLGSYVFYHGAHSRRKHRRMVKEMKEAEESVRSGFALLRRDIEAELAVIKQAKLSKELSAEAKVREEQLLKDMAWVEQTIGKEVWDIEKTEYIP